MTGGMSTPPPRPNPFSALAVAKVTKFDESDWAEPTIETSAVVEARTHMSAYLNVTLADDQQRDGEVIALVGDYGSGKSHLAAYLARQALRVLQDAATVMYLDATVGSFVDLYGRFLRKLGREGLRSHVNEYYADVVADALREVGLDNEVMEWLRTGELGPQVVVDRLALMESALLRSVQHTLRRITDNEQFGTALSLLLRPGFEDAVWRWLSGGEPDDVLIRRGITSPINTEGAALEAMGVFAQLYSGRRARFVLVIDELEKMLPDADRPEADGAPTFEKLVDVFSSAGACLVLCSLPEAGQLIQPRTHDRVTRTVEMVRLSIDEIQWFIEEAQEQRTGRRDLAPFTPESVRYLRDVANGNARKVIRLCHDCFRLADDQQRLGGESGFVVTDRTVREADDANSSKLSINDVHIRIGRALEGRGWQVDRDRLLRRDDRNTRADFWVTFVDRLGGCAILVVESVMDATTADALTTRIGAVRSTTPQAQVVLVYTGMLALAHEDSLVRALDVPPLSYVRHGFDYHLTELVDSLGGRLERVAEPDPVNILRQRIEQLGHQQTGIYDRLDRLDDRLDSMRGSSDRRLLKIQNELTTLNRMADGVSTTGGASETVLPADADRLLSDAVMALDELTGSEPMMRDAFTDPESLAAVSRRLGTDLQFEAIGIASLIRSAITAFRASLSAWYATEIIGAPERQLGTARAKLHELCQAYDDVVEGLPLFRLWVLTRSRWTAGQDSQAGQAMVRERVESAVRNLSPLVLRALERASLSG